MKFDTYMRVLIDEACELIGVDKDYLTNKKRTRLQKYVRVRQMIMKAVYEIKGGRNGVSLTDIGKQFNHLDHSTVINSINRANQYIEYEDDFRRDFNKLKSIAIALDSKFTGLDKCVIYHMLYEVKESKTRNINY